MTQAYAFVYGKGSASRGMAMDINYDVTLSSCRYLWGGKLVRMQLGLNYCPRAGSMVGCRRCHYPISMNGSCFYDSSF